APALYPFRRRTPAGRDRQSTRGRAEADRLRRARIRPRCFGAGAGAESARGTPQAAWPQLPLHYARPRRRPTGGRPRLRLLPRPDRGGGRYHRCARAAIARVHDTPHRVRACERAHAIRRDSPDDMNVELLKALTNAPGLSGFEEPVQEIATATLSRTGEGVKRDRLGNGIGLKKARGASSDPPLRLALMAHADEIGMMVRYIDDRGYVYFDAIGGIHAPSSVSQRV